MWECDVVLSAQGALFLAVESLLVDCERWFRTVRSRNPSMVVPLDFIIEAWFFAQKHGECNVFVIVFLQKKILLIWFSTFYVVVGVTFVEDVCPGYLAQSFVGTTILLSQCCVSFCLQRFFGLMCSYLIISASSYKIDEPLWFQYRWLIISSWLL